MTERPLVFGILNLTPDSFSDGGKWAEPKTALAWALAMREQGADVIDVGGESTRPGAVRILPSEEWQRVGKVVKELVDAGVPVSLDTMNSSTAELAIAAGASYINDVSGGLADPAMAGVVSAGGVKFIAMHGGGRSETMDLEANYENVTKSVTNHLRERTEALISSGIAQEKLWLDPGIGFAKTPEHNWQLLRELPSLVSLGFPVMIGASRKRFLAPFGDEPEQRDAATANVGLLAAQNGAGALRVHNVKETVSALRVLEAWQGE